MICLRNKKCILIYNRKTEIYIHLYVQEKFKNSVTDSSYTFRFVIIDFIENFTFPTVFKYCCIILWVL